MAIELSSLRQPEKRSLTGLPLYIVAAVALLGGGLFYYLQVASGKQAADLPLTPEAKEYVRSLQLSDVDMKASESYFKQVVVEIQGKITDAGSRNLDTVDIYCIFRDAYGQLVLRKRVSIVSPKMGGLKPGETKAFRLPFDEIPDSWNHAMPQLVIAGIKFP